MSDIGLICLDLDGTLLQDHWFVSDENRKAVKYAIDKGIYVCLNTGRVFTSAAAISKDVGLNAPVIASNGTIIADNKKIYVKHLLDKDLVNHFYDISKKYQVAFHIFKPDECVMYGSDDELSDSWGEEAKKSLRVSFKKADADIIDNIDDCLKVSFTTLNKDIAKKIIGEISQNTAIDVSLTWGAIIEVTGKGINKGSGLLELKKLLGIEKKIMAVGDDGNDVNMLLHSDIPVAMGNALPAVKEGAVYLTETCENNGVAKAIYHFI